MSNKEHEGYYPGFSIFIIIILTAVLEYSILHLSNLSLYSPSLMPMAERIRVATITFYPGIIQSTISAVTFPLAYVPGTVAAYIGHSLYFIVAVASMFYSTSFFIRRVTELPNSAIFLIALPLAMLYPLHPFFGGDGFETFFDALLPLFLAVAYRNLFGASVSKWRNFIIGSISVAVTAAFLVTDFKTIVYVVFFYLTIFGLVNVENKSLRTLRDTTLFTLLTLVIFLLLMLRFVMATFADISIGVTALGSTVELQLNLAYQTYPVIYSIAGTIQWFATYRPELVIIGLVPFLSIIFALILKPRSSILRFFTLLTILLFLFDSFGGSYFNVPLGQTHFFSYLPIIYPNYVLSVLYIPILLITFTIALSVIAEWLLSVKIARFNLGIKKGVIRKIAVVVIIAGLLGTQAYYFFPNMEKIAQSPPGSEVPPSIAGASDYLYSHNISGHVLVIGNFSGSYFSYSDFSPFSFTSHTGWGSNWFWHFAQQMEKNNKNGLARALSYIGVQYIVYRVSNQNETGYLLSQENMSHVYYNNGLYILKNTDFLPEITSHSGPLIAYQFPRILENLSSYNATLPLIPFYDMLTASQPLQYASGIVGYNISYIDIELLMLNSTNSYNVNLGNMTMEVPSGWQQISDINSGGVISALSTTSAKPLNLSTRIKSGTYNVILVGGSSPAPSPEWSIGANQFSSYANMEFSSGSQSARLNLSENGYSPMVNTYLLKDMHISNGSISIRLLKNRSGVPFISRMYFIPQIKTVNLMHSALNYSQSHSVVSLGGGGLGANTVPNTSVSIQGNAARGYGGDTTIVSFEHSYIASFGFTQSAKVSGLLFKGEYDYGGAYVYISNQSNPSIKYNDYSGLNYIYFNIASALAVFAIYITVVSTGKGGKGGGRKPEGPNNRRET